MTDRGTFANSVGWVSQPDVSTRRGHAKIVEVTTDKSTSFAGLAGLLEEWPPEWEDEPIQIYIGGGSARLTKSTFKRTVTEEFDYEQEDGQFAREGTIEDVTERTAESLAAMQGADQDRATFASRNDNGRGTTDRFVGTFVEDGAGREARGVSTGEQKLNAANKNTYTTTIDDENATGFSTATSANKYRSDGTSSGAVQIGPTGATTGPVSFTGNDLSRVNGGGTSLLIRDTNDTLNGVNTKTLTTEGGTGRIRGEVAGKSNGVVRTSPSSAPGEGLGEGVANTTTNVSAVLVGDDHGNGFFIQSTVKTGSTPQGPTKDTELIVSRGNETSKSDGSSDGTIATGRDAKTDLHVQGNSEGDSDHTTTRILTSAAPGTRTYTHVTRTDSGAGKTKNDSDVVVQSGQTMRDGNSNGNFVSGATLVYTLRGNYAPDALAGLPAYHESGSGTLATKVNTNFTGEFESENLAATSTFQISAHRNSTEDSTYTIGWTDSGVDATGHDYYTGESWTDTVVASGNTSGANDVVNGAITGGTSVAGSNGSTEQNTYRKWDYRAKDDFFSRLDESSQSTVTTNSGADEEGNPSLSQSIVNERKYDYFEWLTDEEDYGEDGWWKYVKTVTKKEQSRDAQLVASSGPLNERRQTFAIDNYFWSLDETVERETEYDPGNLNTPAPYYWDEHTTVRNEVERSSRYHSAHTADEDGLAYDGQFTSSSSERETWTGPGDPQSYSERFQDEYTDQGADGNFGYGRHFWDYEQNEARSGYFEEGSYYDLPLSGIGGVRVQSGQYTGFDESSRRREDGGTVDHFVHRREGQLYSSDYDYVSHEHTLDLELERHRTDVEGRYGAGGLEETRAAAAHYRDLYTHYREEDEDSDDSYTRFQNSRDETVVDVSPEGVTTGTNFHHIWGHGNPDILDPVSWQWVPRYDYLTVDEDIFDGLAPDGPKSLLANQPGSEPQKLDSNWWAGTKAFLAEFGFQAADMAIDEVPIAGDVKAGYEVYTGENIRGDELGMLERAGSAMTLIPGGGLAKRIAKGWGSIGKGAARGASWAWNGVSNLFGKKSDEALELTQQTLRQTDQIPTKQLDDLADSTRKLDNAEPPEGFATPQRYPNPDPPMSAPPVRHKPSTIEEVERMRQGKGPTTKASHGNRNIEAHHRQQKAVANGGKIDELEQRIHRGSGNHSRHSQPSELSPAQRAKEIREHFKNHGNEYILPGEGI